MLANLYRTGTDFISYKIRNIRQLLVKPAKTPANTSSAIMPKGLGYFLSIQLIGQGFSMSNILKNNKQDACKNSCRYWLLALVE